ncbi:MAG TPA: hypothetical protein IAA23_00755 [Candidatus Helicobacter avistercoris]|nr:hypothetical protein [Candidatus Helicobacter avistercoris]
MASIWTLFTKGWDAYEEEKTQEEFGIKDSLERMKKIQVDMVFTIWNKGMTPDDEAIQEAHKCAKEIGDPREKRLYDELKERGVKPLV